MTKKVHFIFDKQIHYIEVTREVSLAEQHTIDCEYFAIIEFKNQLTKFKNQNSKFKNQNLYKRYYATFHCGPQCPRMDLKKKS